MLMTPTDELNLFISSFRPFLSSFSFHLSLLTSFQRVKVGEPVFLNEKMKLLVATGLMTGVYNERSRTKDFLFCVYESSLLCLFRLLISYFSFSRLTKIDQENFQEASTSA